MALRVAVALALTAAACGGDSVQPPVATPTVTPTPTPTPQPGWGAAQRIGGGTDADRGADAWLVPHLVVNDAGAGFAVWSKGLSDDPHDISVNRYDPSRGWGTAELMGNGRDPALVVDASGNALLVWGAGARGYTSLQWRRFTAVSGWSAAAAVPITSSKAVSFSLATTPAGSALLVWSSGADLWASGFSSAGVWDTPVRIASARPVDSFTVPGSVWSPKVVLDANGNAAVTWIDTPPSWPADWALLRGTRFTVGSGWGGLWTLGSGYEIYTTRLDGDLAGNALLGWFRRYKQMPGDPTLNRFSPGAGWQDGAVLSALGRVFGQEQLALGPNGTALLIATDTAAGNGLVAMRLDSTGSSAGPIALAGQTPSTVDLDVGSDGRALVVGGTRSTVWAAELTAALEWGPVTSLHDFASSSAQCYSDLPSWTATSPAVRLDASRRALAVWTEWDCDRWSIWASRYWPK